MYFTIRQVFEVLVRTAYGAVLVVVLIEIWERSANVKPHLPTHEGIVQQVDQGDGGGGGDLPPGQILLADQANINWQWQQLAAQHQWTGWWARPSLPLYADDVQ